MSPIPALADPLPPYWILFYERDHPARRIRAILGETPPTPSGGGAGWDQVNLPKRASVTVWRGRQTLTTMDVPIILGHVAGPPVLADHNALHSMFRPPQPTTEPPPIKIYSPSDIVPHQFFDWVITDLQWGDTIAGREGNRVMQKLTVTLLEYRSDEVLQETKAAKPLHRGRTYVVKHGDTLTSIAKRFKVKSWRTIGNAQHPPIHDPRKIRVGQRLLIP